MELCHGTGQEAEKAKSGLAVRAGRESSDQTNSVKHHHQLLLCNISPVVLASVLRQRFPEFVSNKLQSPEWLIGMADPAGANDQPTGTPIVPGTNVETRDRNRERDSPRAGPARCH